MINLLFNVIYLLVNVLVFLVVLGIFIFIVIKRYECVWYSVRVVVEFVKIVMWCYIMWVELFLDVNLVYEVNVVFRDML